MKMVNNFQMKIVIFTAVKNRCMLQGCGFVMSMQIAEQHAYHNDCRLNICILTESDERQNKKTTHYANTPMHQDNMSV